MENASQPTAGAKFSERLGVFIQKRGKILAAVLSGIVAALAATGAVYAFVDHSAKKAATAVEALADRYDELRALPDDAGKAEKTAALSDDLRKAAAGKNFTSARAYALLAALHADKKEWAEAEKNWLEAAAAAPAAYLAPVSLYNAAAAAEERGEGKKALELYTRCADEYKDSFPLASRALFAAGRVNEALKDYAAAAAAYKKLVDQWPNDGWTKLAHSRILSIAAAERAK